MIDSAKQQYFKSKAFKALLDKYEKSSSQGEPFYFDPEELTDIAEYYQANDDDEKAIRVIEKAIRMFPEAVAPLAFRSRYALLQEDNIEKAKYYASKISDISDYDFKYLNAEFLIYEDKLDKADQYLYASLDGLDRQDRADVIYDVANIFIDYEIYDLAEKWINYSDDKTGKDYRETIARIRLLEQDYEQAEILYTKLIDDEPYSTFYWEQLTTAQFLSGKYQEALQSSEFALAIDPTCEDALLTKANCEIALGHFDEAMKLYQKYLQIHPHDGYVESLLANLYLKKDAPQEALIHYDKALEFAKNNPHLFTDIVRRKALLLTTIGQSKEALRIISKCIKQCIQDGETDCDMSSLYVAEGYILMNLGRDEKAMDEFKKAIDSSTDTDDTYFQIGISYYDNGAYPLAYDMLKHITVDGQNEDSTEGWGYYAACCARLGYYEEFIQVLKKGCEVNPDEVSFLFAEILPPDIKQKDLFKFIINKLTK